MTGVAFIDTETTGLNPEIHPIWEIAVIVDDMEHCWQQRLTKPQLEMADPIAQEMTNFDKRYDPMFALSPTDSLLRLADLVRGRHWVGAVPSFDEERVRRAWYWACPEVDRWPWHYHLIDVEAMAVGWLHACGPEFHNYSNELPWRSDELSLLLGVQPPQGDERHSALADARWAKAIYERITQ